MLRISVNTYVGVLRLLETCSKNSINTKNLHYFSFNSIDADYLIELTIKMNYLTFEQGTYFITAVGKEFLNCNDRNESIRNFLFSYIKFVIPAWSSRIPYGRKEAYIFMTKDEQACFSDCGLMEENPSKNIIDWWDNVSSMIRNENETIKTFIGRRGEKETFDFESSRLSECPKWISIDTNKAGYDILSRMHSRSKDMLFIEVKSSSETLEFARFFISRNEWETACNVSNYYFYLWLFNGIEKRLAIISKDKIKNKIPVDTEEGQWENVSIPFSIFADYFRTIEKGVSYEFLD